MVALLTSLAKLGGQREPLSQQLNPWARIHWTNLDKVTNPVTITKAKGMEYAN